MANEMLQANDGKTTDTGALRLLVAMEMSLKTWRLAMAVEGQPRKRVKTVEAGHYLDLAQAVAETKVRLKRPDETKVVFCYEAGRDGFHPYRRLTELGHEVWVIDSASIEVSRKMRRAKSDGMDADKLSELMQRQARGEKALRNPGYPRSPHSACRALRAATAAVSVRRTRGPSRSARYPARSAALASSSAKPPSGPINKVMEGSGASSESRHAPSLRTRRSFSPGTTPDSHAARVVTGRSRGIRVRPHCSQAACTILAQCSMRRSPRSAERRTTERSLAIGTMRETPSSTPFWRV